MKRFIIPFAMLIGLAAVSCDKTAGSPDPVVAGNPSQILFESNMFDAFVETKATTPETTETLTSIYVTAEGKSSSGFSNVNFTKGGSVFSGGQFWPSTDMEYDFYAASKSMASGGKGVSASNSEEKDIVCAYLPHGTGAGKAAYGSTNSLVFEHIFARIGKCVILAPSGYTVSNLQVTFVPKTGGQYDIASGAGKSDATGWSNLSGTDSFTLATAINSQAVIDLYLVPGTYTLNASYTLTKGAYSESFNKSCQVVIVKGKVNNIQTPSSGLPQGNASELQFNVQVNPWDNNDIEANFN